MEAIRATVYTHIAQWVIRRSLPADWVPEKLGNHQNPSWYHAAAWNESGIQPCTPLFSSTHSYDTGSLVDDSWCWVYLDSPCFD